MRFAVGKVFFSWDPTTLAGCTNVVRNVCIRRLTMWIFRGSHTPKSLDALWGIVGLFVSSYGQSCLTKNVPSCIREFSSATDKCARERAHTHDAVWNTAVIAEAEATPTPRSVGARTWRRGWQGCAGGLTRNGWQNTGHPRPKPTVLWKILVMAKTRTRRSRSRKKLRRTVSAWNCGSPHVLGCIGGHLQGNSLKLSIHGKVRKGCLKCAEPRFSARVKASRAQKRKREAVLWRCLGH